MTAMALAHPPAVDIDAAVLNAWREVAIGKLVAFHEQAHRLGDLARQNEPAHPLVADALWDIAEANALTDVFGVEAVQNIMADALGDAV